MDPADFDVDQRIILHMASSIDEVVTTVERNMDDTLRNKDKKPLKFTGVVAWVFTLDAPVPTKWNKAHLEEYRTNA